MVHWSCPRCQKKMYSASDSHIKRTVICLYCGGPIKNPHYQGNLPDFIKHKRTNE